MTLTTASTMNTFNMQSTDDDTNNLRYEASWDGGYPDYQYEVREQGTLRVVDSGTTSQQSIEGVIENPDDSQFTIRVTDAGGDVISTTTAFIPE